MVTLVDQNWKPLLEGLEQINTAVEELILSEKERGVKVTIYTRSPKHPTYRLRAQAIESIYILRDSGATVFECYEFGQCWPDIWQNHRFV